jgi:hypothetical protein
MAANEELLGRLHEAVAADLLRRVQSGEATASEMSVVVKFLKDNGIEALATDNNSLGKLVKEMPEFDEDGGLYGPN